MENDTLTQNWCAAAMQHLQYLANIPAEVHFSQRMFFLRDEYVFFAAKIHVQPAVQFAMQPAVGRAVQRIPS